VGPLWRLYGGRSRPFPFFSFVAIVRSSVIFFVFVRTVPISVAVPLPGPVPVVAVVRTFVVPVSFSAHFSAVVAGLSVSVPAAGPGVVLVPFPVPLSPLSFRTAVIPLGATSFLQNKIHNDHSSLIQILIISPGNLRPSCGPAPCPSPALVRFRYSSA
jgi:hypothetical protein